MLVDRLAPEGSGTRTFAWLVTANNGGLAIGAAVAGALSEGAGPEFGLWFGAACALAGWFRRRPRSYVRTRTRTTPGYAGALSTFRQTAYRARQGNREHGRGP